MTATRALAGCACVAIAVVAGTLTLTLGRGAVESVGVAADPAGQHAGERHRACSKASIAAAATSAPWAFESGRSGRLYGIKTHRAQTAVGWFPGYNSCPLVVFAILREAGCTELAETGNAGALFDALQATGWRQAEKPEAGCVLGWNALAEGPWPPLTAAPSAQEGRSVAYRQLGIAVSSWLAVDNAAFIGRPVPFPIARPLHYEAPVVLCPPER
ncbi:MAG: hypothetical protein NW205_06710 [Hyphomicrobiaceae bacterium]|nr:hypothetical protein [Hyphomicrobiaceae bacterium]